MTRIDDTFARLRSQGKKAFVSYIMAGDPDLETSLAMGNHGQAECRAALSPAATAKNLLQIYRMLLG